MKSYFSASVGPTRSYSADWDNDGAVIEIHGAPWLPKMMTCPRCSVNLKQGTHRCGKSSTERT